MKILVAEDEPMLLKTIELKLKKEGYEVITTQDGREAIAKIEEFTPDLVISDIMMPYASGLEIVSMVKKQQKILFHAVPDALDLMRLCVQAGCGERQGQDGRRE